MTAEGPTRVRDFRGTWQIQRMVLDRRMASEGRFEGLAWITPEESWTLYEERGQLSFPNQPSMTATRRYRWTNGAEGEIVVKFDDGRPFHRFALTGTSGATHLCDPDTYVVSYDFRRWPVWSATWEVSGPRKDYRMTSHYARMP